MCVAWQKPLLRSYAMDLLHFLRWCEDSGEGEH
jgi:hypothetical protein